LQPALKLGTRLNCNPFMADVGMHNGTWRELDVSCRNHARDSAESEEVVGDDGAFNPTGTGNDEIRGAHRANDLAVNIDRTTGGDITLDDQVMGEDAAT
jgi:hypothetical protein